MLLSEKCAHVNVEVLDLKVVALFHKEMMKRQRSYELNHHILDTWAEFVFGVDGRVTQICCKICSEVDGREKFMPKINSFWKHVGQREATFDMDKVKKGEYFYLGIYSHV